MKLTILGLFLLVAGTHAYANPTCGKVTSVGYSVINENVISTSGNLGTVYLSEAESSTKNGALTLQLAIKAAGDKNLSLCKLESPKGTIFFLDSTK